MLRTKNNYIVVLVVLAIIVGVYFLFIKKPPVQYHNTQYSFSVSLPDSWKGFTIIAGAREIRDVTTGDVVAIAPTINIRHPLWISTIPRQDIPIDIYTSAQWNKIISEQYSVSAAPIPPSELAHNNKYVFALPARYNYAFPVGFEEVDQLVRSGIVTAF
jgi:hypothetical protein